jgi:hypothetical protein
VTVRYRHATSLLVRDTGDHVLLLPASGDALVQLSGTGPALWDLLSVPLSVPETVQKVATTYSLRAEDITAEVEEVIRGLLAAGVLEVEQS